MANIRVAKRYAKALIEIAEELKKLDRITSDVQLIDSVIRSSRDLQLFFEKSNYKRGQEA